MSASVLPSSSVLFFVPDLAANVVPTTVPTAVEFDIWDLDYKF
jgi:hypothetical protein